MQQYLAPTTLNDGVRLTIGYTMVKEGETPVTVLNGESEHEFLNAQGRFVRLKRELPECYGLLTEMTEAGKE